MGVKRELLPVVLILIALILAREIYPYAGVMEPDAQEGFTVEMIADGLGGPACLVWHQDVLHICDRDDGRIVTLEGEVMLDGLRNPHGLLFLEDSLIISEKGRLTKWSLNFTDKEVLVDDVPWGNHQTNAINQLPNGTLIWHSGSTCNHCVEEDPRNGALLWVNSTTGEHGILATGIRNSFDGIWVEGMGYLFSDNGQDTEGDDFPNEEVNLYVEGADYGWLTESSEDPVPEGTEGPIAVWTPHSSLNGMTTRPANMPGDDYTVYATVYGSWATLFPKGHQIVKIDFTQTDDLWVGDIEVFVSDAGTPLPITGGPDGNLYYATFDNGGAVFKISPQATV